MTSRMEVHETGYAWRYIRKFEPAIAEALSDLPDIGASMTLVGLFPPVCDNGHLLVDGGYRVYSILPVCWLNLIPNTSSG